MRGFYEFLRSRIHRMLGKNRTIATKTIRVYQEDVNGDICFATGTDAASTQDGIAGYAKGAIYIKTDVTGGTDGRYKNIGTSTVSSFALEAALSAGIVGSAELAETTIKYAEVTLTATEIVGTAAGDIGHASGAVLMAAPGAGKVIEFISAVPIYDYDTAAYTGGGDDLVIKQGSVTLTTPIAKADLLGAAGDKIAQVNALSASDQALTANTGLNLVGTAYTQPGTAAGVLRVKIAYRIHTTGL